jgi:hypothetical protein
MVAMFEVCKQPTYIWTHPGLISCVAKNGCGGIRRNAFLARLSYTQMNTVEGQHYFIDRVGGSSIPPDDVWMVPDKFLFCMFWIEEVDEHIRNSKHC